MKKAAQPLTISQLPQAGNFISLGSKFAHGVRFALGCDNHADLEAAAEMLRGIPQFEGVAVREMPQQRQGVFNHVVDFTVPTPDHATAVAAAQQFTTLITQATEAALPARSFDRVAAGKK